MSDFITIVEVGPRDGFQLEPIVVPTDRKHIVIQRLVDAGLKQIQVASFVHPDRVPQMADAGELIAALPADALLVLGASFSNHTGIATWVPTIQVDFDRMTLGKFPTLSLADAREEIESWRNHYNHVRPHRSLGKKPPAVFAQEAA